MRPRLLDLYGGTGAAARGYQQAGFNVTGIDVRMPSEYGGDAIIQTDAVKFLVQFGDQYDAIHASPPCQNESALTKGNRKREGWTDSHRDMITVTRALLDYIGVPYVMENVQGSTVRRDLTLCGEMFGLGVIRHRYFELGGWTMAQPPHIAHRGRVTGWRHGEYHEGPYFAVYGDGGGKGSVAEWQTAMGIDWTEDRHELSEAIPPAYTEFIGRGLMNHVIGRAELELADLRGAA